MFYHQEFWSPQGQSFLGMDANVWVAIGTFLVVVVALFQDWIRTQWNRTKLKLTIKMEPPDCHLIRLTDQSGHISINSIYLRIRVQNLGAKSAENVEVMITDLWKIEAGGKSRMQTFLPMNLLWSHYGTRSENIPDGVFKHCDLGSVRPTAGHNPIAVMKFDTAVQPNQVSGGVTPNIVGAGKYEFELVATANNAKPDTSLWQFEFDGTWLDSETLMLGEHIKINRIC